MAKTKTTAAAEDKLILETMPGADPISDADAAPFEVDLNFDTPEEEVEFPKEDEIEEISETELTTTPEEMEAEAGQQEETTATAESEDTTETGLDAEGETDTSEHVPTAEGQDSKPIEDKAPMVPKSRLDEVLAKQKALQKQLDESRIQAQTATEAPVYEFEEKETEYQELVLNGESEKAVALRNDIRNAEKAQMMYEIRQEMGHTVQQSQEAIDLQTRAEQIYKDFPVLDENSASYSEDLQIEVLELRDAFVSRGYVPVDALDKATKYVMGAPNAPQPTPIVAPVATSTKRQESTILKKVAASESQPPALKGEGVNAKKDNRLDLTKLSPEEFDALPAETLRRMRGDFA